MFYKLKWWSKGWNETWRLCTKFDEDVYSMLCRSYCSYVHIVGSIPWRNSSRIWRSSQMTASERSRGNTRRLWYVNVTNSCSFNRELEIVAIDKDLLYYLNYTGFSSFHKRIKVLLAWHRIATRSFFVSMYMENPKCFEFWLSSICMTVASWISLVNSQQHWSV